MIGVWELTVGIVISYLLFHVFRFLKTPNPVEIEMTSARGLKAKLQVPHASAANIIGQEIYVEESYLQEGIQLPSSPVVVDVGAHCGMFSTWTLQHFPKAVVLAIEPIESLASMIQVNTEPFTKKGGRCDVIPSACFSSDGVDVTLTYAPAVSFGTSLYADEVDTFMEPIISRDRIGFCRAILSDLEKCGLITTAGRFSAKLLDSQRKLARWLAGLAVLLWMSGHFLAISLSKRSLSARTVRLSTLLQQHAVKKVDLLKIDAEGAEVDILRGLDPQDYHKIQQIVVEVQDVHGRLAETHKLLKAMGFDIVITKPGDWACHRLFAFHIVFARRTSAGQ